MKSAINLHPFNSVADCPACGRETVGFSVEYSTDQKVSVGNGRFVSIHLVYDPLFPHLEKHCPHCGWGWLEQVLGGG